MSEEKERLPVHNTVNVIDYETVYRTSKWWKAVALVNMFGHDKVVVYLWLLDDKTGKWKRKQKLGINNERDWEGTKDAIEKFVPQIKKMR